MIITILTLIGLFVALMAVFVLAICKAASAYAESEEEEEMWRYFEENFGEEKR